MKRKTAALYNPYLDTLGGGEKHTLQIMKTLEDLGFNIHIYWNKDLSRVISDKFDIDCTDFKFIPNVFNPNISLLKRTLILAQNDIFIYVTNGSYFFSYAKNNYIFSMYPSRALYQMNLLNKIKLWNYQFITNSHYTKNWLAKWNIPSSVVYPYIDSKYFNETVNTVNKDKIILSIGRFFGHLHKKNHETMIELFNQLQQTRQEFKEFKLILAGGLNEQDKPYYESLVKLASHNLNITIRANIPPHELDSLYKRSLFYWHFTGFNVDYQNNPEQVEHLGIAPLEAMASKCIVFCYAVGGPTEYIKSGENGFLFKDKNELIKQMLDILNDKNKQQLICHNANQTVKISFSKKSIQDTIKRIFNQ